MRTGSVIVSGLCVALLLAAGQIAPAQARRARGCSRVGKLDAPRFAGSLRRRIQRLSERRK